MRLRKGTLERRPEVRKTVLAEIEKGRGRGGQKSAGTVGVKRSKEVFTI